MLKHHGTEKNTTSATSQPYNTKGSSYCTDEASCVIGLPFSILCTMDNGTILHTFKLREMFLTFDVGALRITKPEVVTMYKDGNKRDFAISVFKMSLETVIDDIIDNGIQFQFPNSNQGKSWFCIQRISGTEYVKSRKNGAFKDFDPVDTNFSAYRIEYCMEKSDGSIVRVPVHLDAKRTKRIAALARAHKLRVGKVKTFQDYYGAVSERYPALCQYDIYRILRFGYFSFRLHMNYGVDIYVQSRTFLLQTGSVYTDRTTMLEYVMRKLKTKARILYRRLHFLWDGYCYFSLSKERLESIKQDLTQGKMIDFGDVMLHKCYDDAFASALYRAAIFKVKAGDETKKFANMEHLVTDKAELVEVFHYWDWDTLSLSTRNYMTILPVERSVQQVYKQNLKPYKEWLRAKRWKELRK